MLVGAVIREPNLNGGPHHRRPRLGRLPQHRECRGEEWKCAEVRSRIKQLVAENPRGFVAQILGRDLGL